MLILRGTHIQSDPVLKWLIQTGFSIQPGLPKKPQLESVLDWTGIFAPLPIRITYNTVRKQTMFKIILLYIFFVQSCMK